MGRTTKPAANASSGKANAQTFARLEAKMTRRCSRSIPDSYIGRVVVATGYAPVPVVVIVLAPLTERKQYSTRNARNTKVSRVVSGIQQTPIPGNLSARHTRATFCEACMSRMTVV